MKDVVQKPNSMTINTQPRKIRLSLSDLLMLNRSSSTEFIWIGLMTMPLMAENASKSFVAILFGKSLNTDFCTNTNNVINTLW